MSEPKQGSGRVQLLAIAAVFFGPLLFAAWLYYKGELIQPDGRTNHGAVLEPIVNLHDATPNSPIYARTSGHWILLYEYDGDCGEPCRYSLYTTRQLRRMLGKEMDRVKRVFLHGDSAPDTVFLADEHPGLITLQDAPLRDLLQNKKPGELAVGGYYLIDPHGNLVMYFHPDLDPRDINDDIKRLLKLSRIG